MPVNIGSSSISGAYVGSSAVKAIYLGSALVWNSFARQRMNKSGTFSVGFTSSELLVTGWASDGTYPAVITGDKLVVQGSGAAVVTCSATTAATITVRLYRNNVLVGTLSSSSPRTRTDNLNLSAGDTLHLTAQGTLSSVSDGYIEVVPA